MKIINGSAMSKSSSVVVAKESSASSSLTNSPDQSHNEQTCERISNKTKSNNDKLTKMTGGHFLIENDFKFIDAEDDESSNISTYNKINQNNNNVVNSHNKNKNDKIKSVNNISLCITEEDDNNGKQEKTTTTLVNVNKNYNLVTDDVKTTKRKNEGQNDCSNNDGKLNNSMTTSSCCSIPTNKMTNIQTKSISSTRIATTTNPIPSDMCNMDLKINNQKCDVVMSENQKKVCENNVTVENSKSEILILDTDPYAELELYLEKVKNEISQVFENLKITEETTTSPTEFVSDNKLLPQQNTCSVRKRYNKVNEISKENLKKNNTRVVGDGGAVATVSDVKTEEWTDNIMGELDDLVQSELRNLKRAEEQRFADYENKNKTEVNKHQNSNSKSSNFLRRRNFFENHKNELKIEEENLGSLKELSSTLQSGKIGVWNSDDSMLRSRDNVDEDNKSSSSCEDGSAVLSSGKSGNSLDSSELDHEMTESGIGTASPPKDQDNWRSLNSSTTSNEKNNWIRRENLIPEINPIPIKLNRSQSSDDPDLLEVLSLFDDNDNNIEEDDFTDDVTNFNDSKDVSWSSDTIDTKSGDSFKKNSVDFDDEYEVVLREKNYSTQSLNPKHIRSFPVKNSNYKLWNDSCNSLPIGKRDVKSESRIPEIVLPRRPFYLTIDQEPFQQNNSNSVDLPSPSSASLHSGHGNLLLQELSAKSSSAPILLKKDEKSDFVEQKMNLRYSRSQSDRYLAEIEAIEACKWLRAAGFPQYAQMYEDLQFPIDLSNVAKDHPFLENDPLQSLYRRLVALNRCATMRLDGTHKHGTNEDSDDESFALSENWTFQPHNRRWSRVVEMGQIGLPLQCQNDNAGRGGDDDADSRDSSPERPEPHSTDNLGYSTLQYDTSGKHTNDTNHEVRFRRTGSERLKDGAKAFLRRVESIKSRRRKRQNRDGVIISGPQVLDLTQMNQRMTNLKCVDVTTVSNPSSPISSPMNSSNSPPRSNDLLKVITTKDGHLSPNHLSPKHFVSQRKSTKDSNKKQISYSNRTSPLHFFSTPQNFLRETKSGDDSSSYCSGGSQDSGTFTNKKKPSRAKRFLQRGSKIEDAGTLSDSECHGGSRKQKYFKDKKDTEKKPSPLLRGGSLNLGKESKRYRENFQQRTSFRSRSSVKKQEKQYGLSGADSDREDELKLKVPVVRWHSFQSTERPVYVRATLKPYENPDGTSLDAMSCGQLQVVRKLALVSLTGYMERYCPTHRSGWNWELPKFIKKIKTPDYKDKKVFGVPLLLVTQRTGQTLPKSIMAAIKWLRVNAMDQIGLFRKSGVKSRILKIRTILEEFETDSVALFDGQQAYDVADMVKQYFRDLPECLLSNKISETFIAIFQHLPADVRPEAVYSAVLLLPDENREVLQILLEFLHHVAEHSKINQMTPSNLAVCLAPSLFHNGSASRTTSVSPRRRKNGTGVPDPRELAETKASHDCLTFLIENHIAVFSVTAEKMTLCNFGYMEESKPVTLDKLGECLQVQDWRGYLYECTSATIKEGREKSRAWISIPSFDSNVEIAYKKVGDGHPLRLWRCTTEVEAPPMELLNLIVKERHSWDTQLIKWRVLEQLNENSQIFQYVCGEQNVTDYCVLRSWRSDLPRGACVVVETSIEHPEASLLLGGVRGVVLASRYLIEPCGSGKSKIMHLARVDTKGRSPEWYNKNYGHICSQFLTKIRNSFKQTAQGPESKV